MWYLPTEVSWQRSTENGVPTMMVGMLWMDLHERKPRTWDGNGWWITGNPWKPTEDRDGQDHVHFAYIKYIQEIEDYDKAVEWSVFGERILKLQLSDTPQGDKQQAALFWGSPTLPPI